MQPLSWWSRPTRSWSTGRRGQARNYKDVVINAVKEVGGPSFFALLVIAVSFMPVFTLEAQEGRLFKPLAFTKNFSMAIAAILGHHPGPGHPSPIYSHGCLPVPAQVALPHRQCRAGRQDPQ